MKHSTDKKPTREKRMRWQRKKMVKLEEQPIELIIEEKPKVPVLPRRKIADWIYGDDKDDSDFQVPSPEEFVLNRKGLHFFTSYHSEKLT